MQFLISFFNSHNKKKLDNLEKDLLQIKQDVENVKSLIGQKEINESTIISTLTKLIRAYGQLDTLGVQFEKIKKPSLQTRIDSAHREVKETATQIMDKIESNIRHLEECGALNDKILRLFNTDATECPSYNRLN